MGSVLWEVDVIDLRQCSSSTAVFNVAYLPDYIQPLYRSYQVQKVDQKMLRLAHRWRSIDPHVSHGC